VRHNLQMVRSLSAPYLYSLETMAPSYVTFTTPIASVPVFFTRTPW
jgi:hypothetical protein